MEIRQLKWWQLALLSVVVSAVGGLSAMRPKRSQRALYNRQLRQAPWAPPSWLFGPAWTFNNIFLLMALRRIMLSDIPEKKKLLVMQSVIWLIFFSFGYVYFNRHSPVLASIWTVADAALAVASFAVAYRSDRRLSADYIPLAAWTLFASSLAIYQALNNSDPVVEELS